MNRGVLKNVGVVFSPLETRDGELWFYDRGITRFRPESIREELNVAPVFLTGFTRDGESLELGPAPEQVTEIHLDWRENSFEFEVAALDYRNPAATRYRYRLKGVDSDWYEAGGERRGRYVGLPGGDYTLEAMAANEDGDGANMSPRCASSWTHRLGRPGGSAHAPVFPPSGSRSPFIGLGCGASSERPGSWRNASRIPTGFGARIALDSGNRFD